MTQNNYYFTKRNFNSGYL